MKPIILTLLLSLLPIIVFSQKYFVKDYTNYRNCIFYDACIVGNSIYLLTSGLGDNFGNDVVLVISMESNELKEVLDISNSSKSGATRISVIDSSMFVLNEVIIPGEFDSILVTKNNLESGDIENQKVFPFKDYFLRSSWIVEKDSLMIMAYVEPEKVVKYIRLSSSDLSSNDSLTVATYLSVPAHIQAYTQDSKAYIVFSHNALFYWNENANNAQQFLIDTVFTHGKTVSAISEDGYVVFARGIDKTNSIGAQLTLTKVNNELSFEKSVFFGTGFPSYDYPALNSSIDKDSSHYFVAAHINISLYPYSSTTPKSFYVGKYDEDLNKAWLHVLGGDRHYFISGVNADNEGGCYVYGFTRSSEYNFQGIPFLMRLNADGMITSTEPGPSEQYHLTLYGNPGQEAMRFGFGSAEVGFQMQLLDLQGKLVGAREVHQGIQEINMAHAPAGMYIWQLYNQAGILVNTGKWMKAE